MIPFLLDFLVIISGTINVLTPSVEPVYQTEEVFYQSSPIISEIAKEKVEPIEVVFSENIEEIEPSLVLAKEVDTREIKAEENEESLEPENLLENLAKKNPESKEIIVEEEKKAESEIPEEVFLEKIEELAPIINSQENPLPTPEHVKGIYMTGYTFSSERRRNELLNLIKKTELNTVVIDTQDPDGNLMFPTEDETVNKIRLADISMSREKFRGILDEFQAAGVYTIARVTTFQDEGAVRAFPELNLKNKAGYNWKNYKGIGWLEMTDENAWQIPLKKAQESAKIGFDEVQFDYIRFPSDGRISQIGYKNLNGKKKYEVLEEFFTFLHDHKSTIGVPISIDLFGVTYANYTNTERDLAIGQRLIGAVKYFDYLSPMIYPSHYANGHMGYANPAKFPYQVVNKAMADGHNMIEKHTNESVNKSRPWLQAFNMGAVYDYAKIRAEIKAVDDNNGSGWILWNARNRYEQAF